MLTVLAFLTAPARAANLCSLTQAQVQDVLNYYNVSMTYNQVLPWIAAPVNCAQYGDLCAEVGGATNAATFICGVWTDAKNHVSKATMASNASAAFFAAAEAYEIAQFPDGIPDDDDWWGAYGGASFDYEEDGCDHTQYTYISDAVNDFKYRSHSWYTNIGVYKEIGTNAKGYIWDDAHGDWDRVTTSLRLDWFAAWQCGSTSNWDIDTVRTLKKEYSAGGFDKPSKDYIEGDAWFEANTCREANWNKNC